MKPDLSPLFKRARLAGCLPIRLLRIDRCLSLEALSEKSGVPVSSISRFETGLRQPRPALAADLLRVLLPDTPEDRLPVRYFWPDIDAYWARNGRKIGLDKKKRKR